MIGGIAFVNLEDVLDNWTQLKATILPETESFADYYKRTWFRTHTTSLLFSHWIWNQGDALMLSWHGRFTQRFQHQPEDAWTTTFSPSEKMGGLRPSLERCD